LADAPWWTRNLNCVARNFRSPYERLQKKLLPVLSSIHNIGYELGENSHTAEWYRANHRTPWVATMVVGMKYDLACLDAAGKD